MPQPPRLSANTDAGRGESLANSEVREQTCHRGWRWAVLPSRQGHRGQSRMRQLTPPREIERDGPAQQLGWVRKDRVIPKAGGGEAWQVSPHCHGIG